MDGYDEEYALESALFPWLDMPSDEAEDWPPHEYDNDHDQEEDGYEDETEE